MKRKALKKLSLHRETLRDLDQNDFSVYLAKRARGGAMSLDIEDPECLWELSLHEGCGGGGNATVTCGPLCV